MRNGSAAEMQIFSRLLQNPDGVSDREAASAREDALGGGLFTPLRPNEPTPQHVADMAAFEQLLNPTTPAADARRPAPGAGGYSGYTPPPDPNLDPARPGHNPAGNSFAPLDAAYGQPKRLTPLPGIESEPVPAALAPSWAPQPPPWTQDTPQLFKYQVRKF